MPEQQLKQGWTRVKFGEVVRLSKTRSVNPEADGIERYVGLEHIEPDDLRIRRWGLVAEGTTFTTRFKPGQVLFGKRRAYQRKVAVADFEGVCSGDIYVLESANPKHLLQELLPFICQTERFFEHAVGTSAGSLSPRTNWTSLANFEFALPPLDEQKRIIDFLWAATNTRWKFFEAVETADQLYEAVSIGLFSRNGSSPKALHSPENWSHKDWDYLSLENLVKDDAPICYGIVQPGQHLDEGVPTLAIKDLSGNFTEAIHRTSPKIESKYSRSRVIGGDVLVSVKATIGEIAIIPDGFQGNISRDIARLRFSSKIDSKFFVHLWKCPFFKRYVSTQIVGSTRAELSIGRIKSLIIPTPKASIQQSILNILNQVEASKKQLLNRSTHAFNLERSVREKALIAPEEVSI